MTSQNPATKNKPFWSQYQFQYMQTNKFVYIYGWFAPYLDQGIRDSGSPNNANTVGLLLIINYRNYSGKGIYHGEHIS